MAEDGLNITFSHVEMGIRSEFLCISWFHFVKTVSEQSVLNEAQGKRVVFVPVGNVTSTHFPHGSFEVLGLI